MSRKFLSAATVVAMMTFSLTACDSSDKSRDRDEAPPPPPASGPAAVPTSFNFEGEPCAARPGAEAGTLYITLQCVDPEFTTAFIDVNEDRTAVHSETGETVTYRYIHGGFGEGAAKFAFFFPTSETFKGRFFQSTYPTVGTEGARPDDIVFAIKNGAYVVSSNNGGGVTRAPTTGGYRVNAAAAKLSRRVAAVLYGESTAVRGHIYGASGGAYQTIGAAENTEGVWNGSIPMVPGVSNAIPSFQAVQVLGMRALASKLPDIVDALEPGGSGDPYATLNADERAVLEEVTRMGFPLRGWWQWQTLTGGSFEIVGLVVNGIDSSYVNDFFTSSGYEGFDDPDVQALRVQFPTTAAAVSANSMTLAGTPMGYLRFADLLVTSGAAAGSRINNVRIQGNVVTYPSDASPTVVTGLAIGDQVTIDNSLYVALQYYQRHQVPDVDQYGWNQYRSGGGSGAPLYVQRSILVGQVLTGVFGGIPTGNFNGKMIMMGSTLDVEAFPWSVDWYRKNVTTFLGSGLDDRYRHWFTENADHTPPRFTAANAHIVDYSGTLQQALLYLDDWVATGTAPPASSSYTVSTDTQIELADTADARAGVQPVVELTVTAGGSCVAGTDVRVDVNAGDPVALQVTAAVKADAGKIVNVEWDFESTGTYPLEITQNGSVSSVQLCQTHAYSSPGTYFPVVRVTTQRDDMVGSDYGRVTNLARARVVVQ